MKFISTSEESRLQVVEDISQFLRWRKVEKLLSQLQLVIGSVQPIFIKRKILLVPMQEYPAADDRLVNTEKKKHLQDTMV